MHARLVHGPKSRLASRVLGNAYTWKVEGTDCTVTKHLFWQLIIPCIPPDTQLLETCSCGISLYLDQPIPSLVVQSQESDKTNQSPSTRYTSGSTAEGSDSAIAEAFTKSVVIRQGVWVCRLVRSNIQHKCHTIHKFICSEQKYSHQAQRL